MKHEIHPYAEIFPIHGGESLDELARDIQTNGLLEPIELYCGKVLDGRRRLAACEKVGVPPSFRQYIGRDPLGFVISKNLHRRHLDSGERAMVAAKIANLKEGKTPNTAQECAVSQERAAEMLNVSRRSVQNAAKVQASAEPEVVEAVNKKQATVTDAAAIADKPPAVQKAAVKAKANGKAKTLKEGAAKAESEANDDEGKVDDAPWVDAWGIPITASAAEAFKAQDAFDELIAYLRAGQKMFKALATLPGAIYLSNFWQEGKDGGFTHPGLQSVIHNLQDAKPKYTVCPYAYSHLKGYVHDKKCNTCHGLGWMATIGKSFMPPEALINEAKKAHGVEVLGF